MDVQFEQLLLGALTIAFGLWAGTVRWGVREVIKRIDTITKAVARLDSDLNSWVHSTEHRITHLEEWRNHVEDKLEK